MGITVKLKGGNPLDHVRMTDSERTAAQAALERGERIAGFIVEAMTAIRFGVHALERGVRALTRAKSVN